MTSRFLPAHLILGCCAEHPKYITRINIQRHPTLNCKTVYVLLDTETSYNSMLIISRWCLLFSTREVLLNVTNELYETDVYNVMGVIKGSTHPGKLSNSTREWCWSLVTLVLLKETLYAFILLLIEPAGDWALAHNIPLINQVRNGINWRKYKIFYIDEIKTHEPQIIRSRLFNRLRCGVRREQFL